MSWGRWDWVGVASVLTFGVCFGALSLRRAANEGSEDARLLDPSAEIQTGTEWAGLYLKGQKVGLLKLAKTARAGGGYTFDLHTQMKLLALHGDASLEARVLAAVDPALTLERFTFEVTAGPAELSGRGTVDGQTVRLSLDTGGETIERTLELAHKPVLRSNLGPLLSRETLEPGARFRYHAFDPLTQGGQLIEVEVIGPTTLVVMGQEVPCTRIRQTVSGLPMDAWVNHRGEMLRQEMGLGLVALRETEEEARWGLTEAQNGQSRADLIAATQVQVSGLPDALTGRDTLALRLGGVDVSAFDLADRRQTLVADVLTIRRESVGRGLARPVAEAPPGSLEGTALVQADHPRIRSTAGAIIGQGTDTVAAARAVMAWVRRRVTRKIVSGVPSALETLERGVGDCNEHATLFAALARAGGVPTRIVTGLVYEKGRFGYHAWNEVLTADGWLSVDPTWGQMPADVGHLRFLVGGLKRQVELLRIIGQLKLLFALRRPALDHPGMRIHPPLLFSLPVLIVCVGCFDAGSGALPTEPADAAAQPPASDAAPPQPPDAPLGPDATEPDATVQDATGPTGAPWQWHVQVPADAPEAVGWAADDVVVYLGLMGQTATREAVSETCEPGLGQVIFAELPDASAQTWRIAEEVCAGGRRVIVSGGGLLGRQYAAYTWLHALGVRFFHPEQEFVPPEPRWPDPPMDRTVQPDFRYRSVSLHLTHPLELGDAFRLGQADKAPEVKRYIDWGIKNFASSGSGGMADTDYEGYGFKRGFPRQAGFSLYNQQQGASNVLDPDDPDWQTQIAEAIDARMQVEPTPEIFGFTFNPTEFTEADDRLVVEQLTFIATYFADHYPSTLLNCINHGTHGAPTPHFGVRYFDLPQFAPANLGVRIHTLMFYDLQRPAPVYGNADFHFLFDFMAQEYLTRNLWYFPEAAWWLTFDNAVPLYLPITVEARSRDLDLTGFMREGEGKLIGHHVFGTGHEWGYWQNEYCSYRMAADPEYRWRDCFADIASPTGGASDAVEAALADLVAIQERDFIYDPDLLAYLVGSDPETEAAAAVGVVFHPLPPTAREIMRWDPATVETWQARIRPALARAAGDYGRIYESLVAVADQVPEGGRPWFDEIRDGVRANQLRAQHALEIYGAVVGLRASRLTGSAEMEAESLALLEAAEASTAAAIELIRQRELGYRYRPLERSIAGGPTLDQDDNWTIYPYRYLARTHEGYYYTRPDTLAREAFEGGALDASFEVADVLLTEDAPLVLRAVGGHTVNADFGDGTTRAVDDVSEHTYPGPGVYSVVVRDDLDVQVELRVAVVPVEHWTGYTGTVIDPAGAAIIEQVLPGITLGAVDDAQIAVGFSLDPEAGAVGPEQLHVIRRGDGAADLQTVPTDVLVPIVNRAADEQLAAVTVRGATFALDGEALSVRGQLPTDSIVNALVAVGGFEPTGARALVASMLGFTADTLPDELPFRVDYAPVPDEGG